jgi:flagellar biosynthesis protein FlhF
MKVRRYFAADMRAALKEVRERQGGDAVILSNRRIAGGVELIAADETYEPVPKETTEAPRDTVQSAQARQGPELVYTQSQVVSQMRDELRGLRSLLEGQVSGLAWGEMGRRDPLGAALLRRAMALGFSPKVARSLIRKAPIMGDYRSASRVLLGALMQALPIAESDPVGEGGALALVGPTGVGKTTLIAKIAIRFAQRHGTDGVALVSLDDQRVGAHEQLRRFGAIAGVAVLTVSDAAGLRRVIEEAQQRQLILIDTAGVCHRDTRFMGKLAAVIHNADLLKTYLVISAATEPHCLDSIVKAYRQLGPDGCMLTKLDETSSMGPALSVAIEQQLPMVYLSDGQQIPDDFHPADPQRLVRDAVRLTQSDRVLEEERMEAAFEGGQVYGWV